MRYILFAVRFVQFVLWLAFSHELAARWQRAVLAAGLVRRYSAWRRGLSLRSAVFAVRDVLTVTKISRNGFTNLGSLAAPANGGAFTQANGQVATPKRLHKFMLLVYNSKAGAIVITIKAGAYPPALSQGQGDLSFTVTTTVFFTLCGPFEAARFMQADGSIQIDTDAGATGTMWAFEVPA